jgi:A118 family predicted phage portal protein
MLPAESIAWPPLAVVDTWNEIAVHDAWYSGDTTKLASAYSSANGYRTTSGPSSPGVIEQVRRFFWGTSQSGTQTPYRLHIPLASDIATKSADLIFSEPPDIKVKDKTTQKRIEAIVKTGINTTLLEAAEIAAALGGVYLKIDWDKSQFDEPIVSAVHPDCAWPKFSWGRMVSVIFCDTVHADATQVWRHLQEYGKGYIEHGLYIGTPESLGRQVPLTERSETEPFASLVDPQSRISTPENLMLAWYIPNMRPNRKRRGSPDGRSDYQTVEPIFDALDEAWTSWMRDLRLGVARLIAPESYLQNLGAGKGASFNLNQEVWTGINSMPSLDKGGSEITQSQFNIRVAEHSQTCLEITEIAIRTAGYSAQSFGLTSEVAATATEIQNRERQSFITRGKKIKYCEPPLYSLIEALLIVDNEIYRNKNNSDELVIKFGDSVQEDALKTSQTIAALHAAQAISIETGVRMGDPQMEDADVLIEVQKIKEETGVLVTDPLALNGQSFDMGSSPASQKVDNASQPVAS